MRQLQYLSPTSLETFRQSAEGFYVQYLAEARPPRPPQTQPMAVGSAFDAYAKSYLHEALFGKTDPRFELDTLFEAQVEPHNREWARENGKHAFACYGACGSLAAIREELAKAKDVHFEHELRGNVAGVEFLGKPDIRYTNAPGAKVVFDFKVNGYLARRTTSPAQGYVQLRTVGGLKGAHPDAMPFWKNGAVLNLARPLERVDERWATQLAVYGWLCGAAIGGEFVAAIDQLVCSPTTDKPAIRVAEHRTMIGPEFQWQTFRAAAEIWERVTSGHFYPEVSLKESQARCQMLENQAKALCSTDPIERFFAECTW